MPCAFCGEGDEWIKTCRTKDGLIRVCDPCWEALSPWLVMVPGNGVVTARCDGCGAYFNPRKIGVQPGRPLQRLYGDVRSMCEGRCRLPIGST